MKNKLLIFMLSLSITLSYLSMGHSESLLAPPSASTTLESALKDSLSAAGSHKSTFEKLKHPAKSPLIVTTLLSILLGLSPIDLKASAMIPNKPIKTTTVKKVISEKEDIIRLSAEELSELINHYVTENKTGGKNGLLKLIRDFQLLADKSNKIIIIDSLSVKVFKNLRGFEILPLDNLIEWRILPLEGRSSRGKSQIFKFSSAKNSSYITHVTPTGKKFLVPTLLRLSLHEKLKSGKFSGPGVTFEDNFRLELSFLNKWILGTKRDHATLSSVIVTENAANPQMVSTFRTENEKPYIHSKPLIEIKPIKEKKYKKEYEKVQRKLQEARSNPLKIAKNLHSNVIGAASILDSL